MRRAHFLRANHGAKLPDLLIAIDTETDAVPIGPGAVDAVLRFGWLAISARHRGLRWTPPRWHRFTTPDEAWDVIEAAIPDGWTARLVAHNAGFDARVLHMWSALPARGWTCRGAVIEDPPTIVRWRKGRRGIVLLDSLNWYRAKLADVGVALGLPKLDHDLAWGDRERDDAYCRRDVEIVLAAVQGLIRRVAEWDLGNLATTISGQAYNAWRHRHLSVPVLIDDHPRALALARQAYHGGRTEAWQLGRIAAPVVVFDVTSMYPAIMLTTPMPTVLRGFYNRVSVTNLTTLLERSCVIADVTLATESADYPLVHDGRLVFPVGRFRTALCTAELTHALRAGHVRQVHAAAVYDRALIFTSYIAEWHTRRQAALAAGDAADADFCKRMMNHLYGKLGQSGRVFETVGTTDADEVRAWAEWDADTGTLSRYRAFGGLVSRQSGEVEARESHPAIAAHVTSAARMRLLSLLDRAGRANVVYMDTDSLFVLPAGVGALLTAVRPSRPGALKLVEVVSALVIHGAKDYAKDDHRVIKGIRANATEIGPATFEQDVFQGLKGALEDGDLDRMLITRGRKVLSRDYRKGTVGPTGRVSPYRLGV